MTDKVEYLKKQNGSMKQGNGDKDGGKKPNLP